MFGLNTGFMGDKDAIRDIVALNAAAGISAYELAKMTSADQFNLKDSLAKNFAVAIDAIENGKALAKLNQWVEKSESFGE
jgi:anthranilate phosphoribosyltransferase